MHSWRQGNSGASYEIICEDHCLRVICKHQVTKILHYTMSERLVNDLTLQYFTSRDFENKLQKTKTAETPADLRKDKRFYKKRIVDLTKRMLSKNKSGVYTTSEEELPNIPNDVVTTFEAYTRSCVEYFKSLDRTDIMQGEYDNISCEIDATSDPDNASDICGVADEMFLRSIQMKSDRPLDKFVLKKKVVSNSTDRELPREKNINLSSPRLKEKGIRKKKNLHNKYGEASQETTRDPEASKTAI